MSLNDLIDLTARHQSLQRAEIISAEGYCENIIGVKGVAIVHRFLILELRRLGQYSIWLRLDRKRGQGIGLLAVLAASWETSANDTVRDAGLLADEYVNTTGTT